MRKFLLITLLSLALLGLSVSQALSFGFGGFVEGGSGSGEFETTWDSDDSKDKGDVDLGSAGFGFVMDSNLAQNKLFNYRLNIGFGQLDVEPDGSNSTLELAGLTIDNTFGFGVLRTEMFRLWLGPQIHLGFYAGEEEDPNWKEEYAVFAFGIAPVVGANLNLGRNFTVSLTAGYRFLGFAGGVDWSDKRNSNNDDTGTLTGDGGMAFLNLSAMFRTGADNFR